MNLQTDFRTPGEVVQQLLDKKGVVSPSIKKMVKVAPGFWVVPRNLSEPKGAFIERQKTKFKFAVIIAALCLGGCTKEPTAETKCDCTYYSEEKTTANPTFKITYQSTWEYCGDEDFGTSIFTHYDGTTTTTHTFVKCK